jgi:hypothetical protein
LATMVIFFLRGGGLQALGCMMLCIRVVPAARFLVGEGDPEAVNVVPRFMVGDIPSLPIMVCPRFIGELASSLGYST